MQRSSLIATVIATAGVFVAATVASVAVVNAASSSDADHGQISLVSTTVAQASPVASDPSAPTAAPSLQPSGLPVLPSATPSTKPKKPSSRPSPEPTKSSSTNDAGSGNRGSVSSRQAANTALAATDGKVIAVAKAQHGAYQAWAVRIQRADGSIVTGYVDRSSGTAYDWVVNQGAPSPGSNSSSGPGNGNGEHDSGDDHNGDDDHHESNGGDHGNDDNGGDHGHDGDDD